MPAIFTVDRRSGVPIYLQLREQVKRAVALGALAPGEQLPTVKALSLELTLNVNTVARVYRELERDDTIETSPGRGSFVRDDERSAAQSRQAVSDIAQRELEAAVRELKSLSISVEELHELFERAVQRWYSAKEREETP